MIFQRWVLTHCDGKTSEAIRRIEAVSGGPVDTSRVYRAMRKPLIFTGKLARDVVAASDGACTLAELIDVDLIREQFAYTNPDLHKRGLDFVIAKAERKAQALARRADAAVKLHGAQLNELERLIAERDAIGGPAPKPKRVRVAARPAKRPKRKRRAGARAA